MIAFNREGVLAILTGVASGIFAGLSGVGGGAILVPMMNGFLNVPQHKAHGTSLAVMTPVAIVGTLGYALQGYLDWVLMVEIALGSAVGVIVGAKLMMRMPAQRLRQLFGAFLLLIALRMLAG